MEITLQTIRDVLRTPFGHDSIVTTHIRSVAPDTACPTACINATGDMRYNPGFVQQHVDTPEDLFCLVAHELMHPLFNHFIHGAGELENIGADMVINALLTRAFPVASGKGSLFRKFYPPKGLTGLLRPESNMLYSRYYRLYDCFYGQGAFGGNPSTGEVIRALRALTPMEDALAIVLLGSHGQHPEKTEAWPAELRADIAECIRDAAKQQRGQDAGFGAFLNALLIQVLNTHLSIRKVLLSQYATHRKVDRFKRLLNRPAVTVTPLPLRPSKRDLVMLAAGMPPVHYHNTTTRPSTESRGLAVYLDVSGSVNQHLPKILGVLRHLKEDLRTIFLFSNKVVEIPFKELMRGKVQTTYGTDFDCIARDVIKRDLDKIVVLTDGYASLKPDLGKQLQERRLRVLTILFGGKSDCPEFATLGDVVQLSAVCN